MSQGDTYLNAFIGAVVTVVTSFTVVSPVLGGAVAAYLDGADRSRGVRVGAISGVIASIPLALVFLLIAVVFSFLGFGGWEGLGVGLVAIGITFLVFLAIALYTVGLSALGGYLGGMLGEDRGTGPTAAAGGGAGGEREQTTVGRDRTREAVDGEENRGDEENWREDENRGPGAGGQSGERGDGNREGEDRDAVDDRDPDRDRDGDTGRGVGGGGSSGGNP